MKKGWMKKPGKTTGSRVQPKTTTSKGTTGQLKKGTGPSVHTRGQRQA